MRRRTRAIREGITKKLLKGHLSGALLLLDKFRVRTLTGGLVTVPEAVDHSQCSLLLPRAVPQTDTPGKRRISSRITDIPAAVRNRVFLLGISRRNLDELFHIFSEKDNLKTAERRIILINAELLQPSAVHSKQYTYPSQRCRYADGNELASFPESCMVGVGIVRTAVDRYHFLLGIRCICSHGRYARCCR